MSEDKSAEERRSDLEAQFRDMMRRANMSFVMDPRTEHADSVAKSDDEEKGPAAERLKKITEFSLKPRDIRDYLDRFVVRQDEAKKVLAVAICDHYNHVRRCIEKPALRETEYAKHNIVLLGPTGVGKTYLMRCIAKLIGVPFVKADATKFSETGYVGHDVEDLVRDLVKAADGDVELAQYGIIFVDEIDKIASQPMTAGKDVSGRGVQINLLKLMEDTDVGLFSQTDLIGQMQAVIDMQRGKEAGKRVINTGHILFIVSGVFEKLADEVRRRVNESPIGFSYDADVDRQDGDLLRMAETRDFMDYGFEPEFIGRLPIRVVCDALNAEDLQRIMEKAEGSVLSQYRSDFEGYGIRFSLSGEATRAIAECAHKEKTGARGLMTVLERVFRDFKFELPSTAIKSFEVNGHVVADPGTALKDLLKSNESARRDYMTQEVGEFADRFSRQHGLRLNFDKESVAALVEMCIQKDKTVAALCADRLRDLEYGLKLISRNTGRTTFSITRKFVENPSEELSKRIAASFKKGGRDKGDG